MLNFKNEGLNNIVKNYSLLIMINHWVKTFLLITQLITHLLKNGSSSWN